MKYSSEFFNETFPHLLLISFFYSFGVQVYRKNYAATISPRSSHIELASKIWNFTMCVFSICGTIATWPIILQLVNGDTIQLDKTWFLLYVFSKPLELIDTMFLILKHKPISTLHWTHHLITMLYTWYATQFDPTFFLLFCFLNYVVHSVMYGYYFIQSKNRYFSQCVTILQMIQFVLGLIWVFVCHAKVESKIWFITLFMYSYYLVMFGLFFYQKYIHKPLMCCMCHKFLAITKCHRCQNKCCHLCLSETGCTLCTKMQKLS